MTTATTFVRCLLGSALGILLAGCGGGSGSTDAPGSAAPTVQPTPFPSTQARANSLIDTYLDADGRLLPAFAEADNTLIPTSGTATYVGYLAGRVDGQDVISSLAVDATFARSTLSATASAFQRSDGSDLTGSLRGDGTITRQSGAGMAQLQMTLTGTVDQRSANLLLDGAFASPVGSTAINGIAGQAEGSFGSDIFEDGAFAAE